MKSLKSVVYFNIIILFSLADAFRILSSTKNFENALTSRTILYMSDRQAPCTRRFLFIKRLAPALLVLAKNDSSRAISSMKPEFVTYGDSNGYFQIDVPSYFVKSERDGSRKSKGVIFVAGDYKKATTLSVSIVNVQEFLLNAGIAPSGNLTTWKGLGAPLAVSKLLTLQRDQDAGQSSSEDSQVFADTVILNEDTLSFMIKTPIRVQRPDLLEKELGVRNLSRLSFGKGIMRGDGTFLMCWAGALSTEWDGTKDLLETVMQSFRKIK